MGDFVAALCFASIMYFCNDPETRIKIDTDFELGVDHAPDNEEHDNNVLRKKDDKKSGDTSRR